MSVNNLMTESELKKILQDSGVVGAGGAGFPSYAKLSEKAQILVVNCAECEPLIYTDYMLLREEFSKIVGGIKIVIASSCITHAYLSLKEHTGSALGFVDGQKVDDNITIKFLPNVYPMGDEINLIYEATGLLISPGQLPISRGVVVFNGETLYNICEAVTLGTPVTEKWITVAGNIEHKLVLKVPVGMSVRELFDKLKITIPEGNSLFDGGPSMGRLVNPMQAVISKTTNSLLIIPDTAPAVAHKRITLEDMLRRAASCCCACTRCTEMCPRHLLGYPLEPHKMIRAAMTNAVLDDPELIKTASLCCSCGICAEVCCQDISPKDVIAHLKGVLAKNKVKYTSGSEEYTPSSDRPYRLIPSSRWQSMLGIKKFDGVPKLLKKKLAASKVEISTHPHIGAPSLPVVSVGDKVKIGQLIAEAANGLSVTQHASINGTVISVTPEKIIIEA